MTYVATDLFPLTEIEILSGRVIQNETGLDNLRKGLFVRHGEQSKKISVLEGIVDKIVHERDVAKEKETEKYESLMKQLEICLTVIDSLHKKIKAMQKKQDSYDKAMFSLSTVPTRVSGLKSTSIPVSVCMRPSQASSIGLSAPRK